MRSWWFGAMGVCALAGCSGPRVPVPSAPSSAQAVPSKAEEAPSAFRAPPTHPASNRSARGSELAVPGVDERFAVTRQVTALERSVELYESFIDRAGDDPRYEEAVRRSRARIEDAKITICFLLEKPCESDGAR